MENRIVTFQEKDVYENAEKYFAVSCGMLRRGNRFQKMYEAGLSVRERIKCKENIRAVYAESKNFKFIDNELIVEDIPFICDSFRQIDFSDVESIYLFVITSGEHKVESESIKDSFYADVWGTCYVESGRDALKGMVQDDNPGKYVLDSFGPGYFGMPLSELENFFQLLDCEKAGISLYESGLMRPLKSLAGIFTVMNQEVDIAIGDCKSCIGNSNGCEFCIIKAKMANSI